MQTTDKRITFAEAKYLKHAGKLNDIKVSLQIVNAAPVFHIMDCEFRTFGKAVAYIQNAVLPQIVETENETELLAVAS